MFKPGNIVHHAGTTSLVMYKTHTQGREESGSLLKNSIFLVIGQLPHGHTGQNNYDEFFILSSNNQIGWVMIRSDEKFKFIQLL